MFGLNFAIGFHTASDQSDGLLDFLFRFSSSCLLSKTKSLFFNLRASPNVTNLSIDYGGRYVLVYSLKDFW